MLDKHLNTVIIAIGGTNLAPYGGVYAPRVRTTPDDYLHLRAVFGRNE